MFFLANYTPHAMKGLIGGDDRKAAVEALLAPVGGTLESISFTRGEFDIAVVVDIPDRNSLMGVTMAISASGAFSRISILEELDRAAVVAAAQKVAKVYTPAG